MDMNLNKEPIYRQLTRILRQSLAAGEYSPGQQFPTEKHICESYNVSRATAGKALSALEAEGLLEFRKGIGTFVKEPSRPQDLQSLISFSAMAEKMGKVPGARILEFREISGREAGEVVCAALDCSAAETLFFCRRVRLLDGVPSLLDRRYISARFSPGLTREDAEGSLIRVWGDRYGLAIGSTEQSITATKVSASEARELAAKEGDCSLRLLSVGKLEDGAPLWYEDSLFPGDQYVIKNRVTGLSDALPARRVFIGGS